MPIVSVIVTVYNVENFLPRCLNSILSQTFTDFELLLIDDGSTDNSGRMCDDSVASDRRIKVVHKHNGGSSSARNVGLDLAQGDYIAFIDSDDWVEPRFLEELVGKANAETDIVICEFSHEFKNRTVITDNSLIMDGKIPYLRNQIFCGFTSACNKLFKRQLIKALRFEPMRYSEDFIFSIKALCMAQNIEYVNESLYHYDRTNESSVMHQYPADLHACLNRCDTMMMQFFKEQGIFEEVKQEMYWRILRNNKELVLNNKNQNEFKRVTDDAKDYIFSCPAINTKLKVMMWLLHHNCDFLVRCFILVRSLVR